MINIYFEISLFLKDFKVKIISKPLEQIKFTKPLGFVLKLDSNIIGRVLRGKFSVGAKGEYATVAFRILLRG